MSEFNLGPPSNEDNLIDLLSEKLSTTELIKSIKRFRNVLVHKYGNIDNRLVYRFATEKIDDFKKILQDFRRII